MIRVLRKRRDAVAPSATAVGPETPTGAKTASQDAATGRAGRMLRSTRHWLRSKLGLDRAIGFTVLARGWASFAGLITVALIAHFLSPGEQGYYYTFGSLIALQIVFELGFSFVILQMASHERAHLTLSEDGTISGDPVCHARLASVLQKTVRWYSTAAVFMGAFLLVVGTIFFATHQHPGEHVAWRIPWYMAALATMLTFQIDPILSFMEGCGFVSNVAGLRLVQAMTGSTLAWLTLLLHHGLFAPGMIILGNTVVGVGWLCARRKLLLNLLRHAPGENRIQWRSEVWPFQWRIAVSWLCGYFIYQLFNPVTFAFSGPVVAGQMGMSLSLVSALKSVAISWINTKAAPFGGLIARKEYGKLDHIFFRAWTQAILVCTAGAGCILAGAILLNWAKAPFAHRLLSPTLLAFLLFTAILDITVFGEALYLRAHKQEKFLFISVLSAVLVACSTIIFGRYFGAEGIVIGTVIISVFAGLPLGTFTFLKYRRLWHAT